ncbi:MAG: ATP-binding protein [Elusimicrobia bacterium]|nr:ATP-binding protein [Elusimicrobiota bacterium]
MYSRCIDLPKRNSFFLFGPRLTGKSTLLRRAFADEDVFFLDLIHPSVHQKYLAEPAALLREIEAAKGKYKRVVLDEIQRVPALLDAVHHLMESPSGRHLQFIMSGSSARKLKRSKANLLGGRAWSLELFPLTHEELGDDFVLEKALAFGTLPRIYAAQGTEAEEDLRAYVGTYLTEEIKAEALTRNLGAFIRFLPMAAAESGHTINASNIGREVGISYKTVQEYFQILEDTLLGFWLEPFAKTVRRRMAKQPKFYFFDTGVLRALKKTLKVPLERSSPEFGDLFENFFINEVRRLNSYRRLDQTLSFYRTEAGAEVDLVAQRPGKSWLAMEIKATERPSSSHCSGLLSFADIMPGAELFLVCRTDQPQLFRFGKRTVRALPWLDCLKMLSGPAQKSS